MVFPATTAVFAALFTLLFATLSVMVIGARVRLGVLHGDGANPTLERLVRAQANCAEYVPLVLFLAALLEAEGTGRRLISILLGVTLLARILHPFGMFAPVNSPRQFICRGGGIIVTLTVLIVEAILLLLR